MLTAHLPMLLALLGTVLMAVVIFAPAPLPAPRPVVADVYSPLPFEAFAPSAVVPLAEPPEAPLPGWPALVDPAAARCDAAARLAMVGALAAVRAAWADEILMHALGEETDARVHAAIAAARSA